MTFCLGKIKWLILFIAAFPLWFCPAMAQDTGQPSTEKKEGVLLSDERTDEEMSPGDWRLEETTGLGFGLTFGLGIGVHSYLDFNIRPDIQLHAGLSFEELQRENIFGVALLETSRISFTASARYFPSKESGWFFGGGSGLLLVRQESLIDLNSDSEALLTPIFFDAGWQGWDGYYFTINVIIGLSIKISETDHTNNISSGFDNRGIAKDDFDRAKSFNGILIGFGWYL